MAPDRPMKAEDPIDRLGRAVRRFLAGGSSYGIEMPPASQDQIALVDEVNAAVAPFALPADVEHFYRTWSVERLGLWFGPEFVGLDFALDTWQMHQEERPPWPTSILFPIAYSSHWFNMVELDHENSPGPYIYDCAYAGGRFSLVHPCLASHFEWAADQLEAGRVGSYGDVPDHLRWPAPDDRETQPNRTGWLRGQGVSERDIASFDDGDRREWPRRWNLADGIDLDDYELRGASHTIVEFVAALRAGRASATLHVGFEQQFGTTVRVYDGDDRMVVTLPSEAQPIGSGRLWEIDVTGEHQPDLHVSGPPAERRMPNWDDAMQDDPDRLDEFVRQVTHTWRIEDPPAATVTTARPIELDP
jgi:hypothetical protein